MERMTPNETGLLLLILLAFVCICGFITDKIEEKRKNKDE